MIRSHYNKITYIKIQKLDHIIEDVLNKKHFEDRKKLILKNAKLDTERVLVPFMDSQSCTLEKNERMAQTKRKKNVGRNHQDDVYITTKNIKMLNKEKYE